MHSESDVHSQLCPVVGKETGGNDFHLSFSSVGGTCTFMSRMLHVAGDGRPCLSAHSGQSSFGWHRPSFQPAQPRTCGSMSSEDVVWEATLTPGAPSEAVEGATVPTRVCRTAGVAPETPMQWTNRGTLHQMLVLSEIEDEPGLRRMIGQVLGSP